MISTSLVHAQVEIKANVATGILLIPNFGLEFQVGEKTSIQLDVLGLFKDEYKGNPLHLVQAFGEYRYYQKEQNLGWFVGGHVGFGMFTLQKPGYLIIYDKFDDPATYPTAANRFNSGRIWFYGLSLGYKKAINNRWAVEVFAGGGLSQSWSKEYQNGIQIGDLERPFNGSGEVLAYRGGVMISYKIFPYKQRIQQTSQN